MDVLANAKKHFNGRQELRGPILVPEWSDDPAQPLAVYYKIPNMGTRAKMSRALDEGGLEGIVTCLILMALDADGKPMFQKAQKAELMRSVDPFIIERIASEMDVTAPDLGES